MARERERILGVSAGEGESLREQDSIFISIPVFIVSLRGEGRGGVVWVMTFSLIA